MAQRTYSARLVERQGRLSIQSLQSCSPCCSASSLLLKIGPSMRLTPTIELRRPGRKTIPCEYQSKPVAKVGTAEPSIRNPLYRSIPIFRKPYSTVAQGPARTVSRHWSGYFVISDFTKPQSITAATMITISTAAIRVRIPASAFKTFCIRSRNVTANYFSEHLWLRDLTSFFAASLISPAGFHSSGKQVFVSIPACS
jgi:hypothetical protein